MKAEDLKTKTPDELKALLMDLKKKQFNLRFQRSQGQLENTSQIRTTRRDIARVKTFLNPVASKSAQGSKATPKKAPKAKKEATAEKPEAQARVKKATDKKTSKKTAKKTAKKSAA